jgi:hypothetical protein
MKVYGFDTETYLFRAQTLDALKPIAPLATAYLPLVKCLDLGNRTNHSSTIAQSNHTRSIAARIAITRSAPLCEQ